tara:strand:+ start:84 stop:332 length:249 start_codon:yes stop_codon:yes gene_type:complete
MTKENFQTIGNIVNRAVKELGFEDRMGLEMDLEFVNDINPLRLNDLFESDAGNFAHDICGIYYNFNRQTKTLDNCFLPRFTV